MKKIVSNLLLLVLVAVLILPTAMAAGTGSISFVSRTTGDHVIIPDAEFELYRLADYDIKTLTPTPDFAGVYLTPDRIRTDMLGCVETVEAWLSSHPSIKPFMVMVSGESGAISFTGLDDGIYMIRYKQDDVKDEKYLRHIEAESVIVAIPYAGNNNDFLRDVNIVPKITLTSLYEPLNITVVKRWDDNESTTRPKSVSVGLFDGETQVDLQTLTASNNWTYTWEKLDSRKKWNVKEINTPDGYEVNVVVSAKGDSYLITNTKKEVPITHITVKKVWKNDEEANRPFYIDVALLANGEEIEILRLDDDNRWTVDIQDIDPNLTYTVKELTKIDGYTTTVSSRKENNVLVFTITNDGGKTPTKTPGPGTPGTPGTPETPSKVNITVKKVWVGRTVPVAVKPVVTVEPGSLVTAPPTPTPELYVESTPPPTDQEGTQPGQTGQKVRFNLKKALNSIEDASYDVLNDRMLYVTSEGVIYAKTEGAITYYYLEDTTYVGRMIGENTIEYANGQRDTLNDSVSEGEDTSPAVTPEVVYQMVDGEFVAVHNTPLPVEADGAATSEPSATPGPTATPEPASNEPMSVIIGLLADGQQVQAVELSDGNYWEYTFTDLDSSVNWTVQELNVPVGYEATVLFQKVSDTNYVFTVTNAKIVPIDLSVKKVWDDENNPERPLSVSVALYKDNVQLSDGVTLSEGNGWTTTWPGLDPRGNYSVKEINCPKEYTASYTRQGNTFIVTNKLLAKAQAAVVTGSDFPWYLYLVLAVVLVGGGGAGIWYVIKRRRSA